ncbi:type II secretion system protein [Proteinivorax tanatarense]|uniref:Type II secretion system protein n=1 Tax=Proteinivorax tanatarense TaxID=1260629 RepID=A0AAU7VPE3_9FIRM
MIKGVGDINNKGFSLPMVLMVIMVLSILLASVFSLTQSNTKQIVAQENNLRAYYLARSGIDIAYAAMMEEDEPYGQKIHRLIKYNDEIEHIGLELPQNEPIGSVNLRVYYDEAAKEVIIESKANLIDASGASKLSLHIKYDENNPGDFTKTRWVRN